MSKGKKYIWAGGGTVNVRGKLYGNGDTVPTGGIDEKVLDKLIKRGDLKEKKKEKKKEEKKEEKKETAGKDEKVDVQK